MGVLGLALLVALTTVLIAEFVNGWTDAPNVIATVVSTGALSPRAAIVMAVVFNILGAMGGTAVAATVGRGIVAPGAMTLPAIIATMLSIVPLGVDCGCRRHPRQQVARAAGGPCRSGAGAPRWRSGGTADGLVGSRLVTGSFARLGLDSAEPS